MKVDLLRLRLPPWPGDGAPPGPVQCGWRASDGTWRDGGMLALGDIARRFHPKRIEACLHPGDVPTASFALPPLSGRRLHAAVMGAIEPCALRPLETLVTGFGVRASDGTVPAAWVGRDVVEGWSVLLRRHGLTVRELQLPAAFLPLPDAGWAACQVDRWLVVRTGREQGFTHWLPEGAAREAGIAAHAGGDAALPAVRWIERDGDEAAAQWTGEGWRWSLPVGGTEAVGGGVAALAVPAVAWGAIAAAVWLVGLNVYASQLAAQGQTLKRQMAARVKAAFPDVPVVVNAVQQARQQKDALAAGAPQAAKDDYAGLSRAATRLLAQAPAGQVQGLRYAEGALHIRWRDGAAPDAEALRTLQVQAHEQGLAVEGDAGTLRMKVASDAPVAEGTAQKGPP
ncbi:type II secretion system protein GspL [Variovorax sp. LT1R20]|uniref:type II secretion system protein GspL n=1 Tax=Variovorax sp. LT1R20 TaxID=3443729 RepID=UPI003F483832